MVHALEEIRRLLYPGGFLIEIHPVPNWLFLQVIKDGMVLAAEPKPMTYTEDVLQSERALTEVVDRGFFVVEKFAEFNFITYAATLDELRAHWEQINEYSETQHDESVLLQEEEQFARFESILQMAGEGAEVLIHERGRISRLMSV